MKADERGHVKFEGGLGRVVNIFGGKAAREGVKSTVAVKGDRRITTNDVNGQIVDLAEEKIYELDVRKKTYTVTTFADVRRRMEEARKKAEADAAKAQEKPAEAPPDQNAKEMEVDFTVKETGQRKTINGFDTRQAIMTIGFARRARRWSRPAVSSSRRTSGWRRGSQRCRKWPSSSSGMRRRSTAR